MADIDDMQVFVFGLAKCFHDHPWPEILCLELAMANLIRLLKKISVFLFLHFAFITFKPLVLRVLEKILTFVVVHSFHAVDNLRNFS